MDNTYEVTVRTPGGRRQLAKHELPTPQQLTDQKYWNNQCIQSVAREGQEGRPPRKVVRTAWTAKHAAELLADLLAPAPEAAPVVTEQPAMEAPAATPGTESATPQQ